MSVAFVPSLWACAPEKKPAAVMSCRRVSVEALRERLEPPSSCHGGYLDHGNQEHDAPPRGPHGPSVAPALSRGSDFGRLDPEVLAQRDLELP
jgi:hypothetical protein